MLAFLTELPLPGYRAALAVGIVAATLTAALLGRRRGVPPLQVVDGALAAAVGGLLLGRIAYVAAQWAYFQSHLEEAAAVWRGGLSAPGVLVGGVAGLLFLCRLRAQDPRPLLDLLAPAAAATTAAAWLGCLGAGCGCGVEVRPDQGILWGLSAELPDLYGVKAPRVAVQALGFIWSGGVLGGVLLARPRGRPFPLWLFLHSMGSLGLTFLRQGPPRLVRAADLGLALAGLAFLLLPTWRRDGG